MLIKRANFKIEEASVIDRDVLLYGPRRKEAFIKHDIGKNLVFAENNLDIVAELEDRDPNEWVVFRARAIDAGGSDKTGEIFHGANDNGDFFSEEQLLEYLQDSDLNIRSFESFIGCPVHVSHRNDDPEEARGKIISAFYDMDNHCVYVDGMVDAKAYPQLARGIREGYITDVSMGCAVKYSFCSVCNKKAHTEKDYCDHIRYHKGKVIQGQKVYEKNHGIKFIELSAVTDGACEHCTIQQCYTGPELLERLSDVLAETQSSCESIGKVASSNKNMIKTARGEDVDKLNQSLDLLREVADQILNSKSVDFEFLESIGSLLADLQKLIVDLVEAGFASQTEGGEAPAAEGAGAPEGAGGAETAPPAEAPPAGGGAMPAAPAPAPPMTNQNIQMTGLDNTGQTALDNLQSSKNNNFVKISNHLKDLSGLIPEIDNIILGINNLKNQMAGGTEEMPKAKDVKRRLASNKITEQFDKILDQRIADGDPLVYKDGPYSIKIKTTDVSGYVNSNKVASIKTDELDGDILTQMKTNPSGIAYRLIERIASKYDENGEVKMSSKNNGQNILKEALQVNPPSADRPLTEKQLQDIEGNDTWEQKNDPHKATGQLGATTQKQLDDVPKSPETGKGDWNRVRPDDHKEDLEVTEGQLNKDERPTDFGSDRKYDDGTPAKEQHAGITEHQLDSYRGEDTGSANRWTPDQRSGDYLPTTEGQFEGKDRLGWVPDEVGEGQLEGHRQAPSKPVSSDASPHGRTASKEDQIVKAIVNGFANAVVANRIPTKSFIKAEAGLKRPANIKEASKKAPWNTDGIRRVAQLAIFEELSEIEGLVEQDVDDALVALYEEPNILEDAVNNTVEERVNELSKTKDEGIETVEDKRKAGYKGAIRKLAASAEDVHSNTTTLKLTPSEAGLSTEDEANINSDIAKEKLRGFVKNFFAENGKKIKDINLSRVSIDSADPNNPNSGKMITIETNYETVANFNKEPDSYANPNQPQVQPDASVDAPPATNEVAGDASTDIAIEPAIETAASKETNMNKEAQNPAGTTLPPPGGQAAPAPGGGGDMGGGVESLAPPSPEEDMAAPEIDTDLEDADMDDGDGEPKPFGTTCPVCGSLDVDIAEGKHNCNNCGANYEVEINTKLLNPDNYEMDINTKSRGEDLEEEGIEPTEGEDINESLESVPTGQDAGMGAAGPNLGAPEGPGGGGGGPGGGLLGHSGGWLRLSVKVSPDDFKEVDSLKFASIGTKVPVGMRCPSCSSTKVAFNNSEGICTRCATPYEVSIDQSGADVVANIDYTPKLKLGDEENKWGGRATKADIENESEIKEALHRILSSRKGLVKAASTMVKAAGDPMTICVTDQTSNGYSGDDAIRICASIKELFFKKQAQIMGNDDEDEEENDDQVEFENEIEDKEPEVEEVDDDIEDDDDGMVEITDEEDEVEDELEEEFEEEGLEPPAVELEKLELYGKDSEGNSFEVEYDLSGMEPEVEEGPEDFDLGPDEEDMEGEDEVLVLEDEVEEPESDVFDLAEIFTMPGEEFEEEDEEDELDEETAMMLAAERAENAELLRGGRVSASSNGGGSTLDIKALAQAISMPLDTQAPDVPRDEDHGIRYDGEVEPHESDHPNTAKEMQDGKHRGTAYSDPEIDRGVEQIKATPQKEAGNRVTVKKAEKDPEKPTPEGDDMNHCCPDGSFETGKFKHKDNKGNKKKSEAGSKCKDCGEIPEKCACGGGGFPKKKKSMEGCACSASNDGWFEVKTAQGVPTVKEPVDSIQDDKKLPMSADSVDTLDVPRDSSKGKPQDYKGRSDVNSPTEVRDSDYAFGQEGKDLHNEEVPRDPSGDGIGGSSVTFEKEEAVDATSGSPDTYVQEWQDNVKPTPAGKEDNHATSGPNTASGNDEVKTAQMKEEIPFVGSTHAIGSALANNLQAYGTAMTGGMPIQVTSVVHELGQGIVKLNTNGATQRDLTQLEQQAESMLRQANIMPDSVSMEGNSIVIDLTTHLSSGQQQSGGLGFGASARELVIKEAKKVIAQQVEVDMDSLDAVDFDDKILISIIGTDRLFEVDPTVFVNKVQASQEAEQKKSAKKCECGCEGKECTCNK